MRRSIYLLPLLLAAVSCGMDATQYDWSDPSSWYAAQIDSTRPDIFYLVATEVLEDSDGSHRATLCEEDRAAFIKEMAYAEKNMAGGDFNFISPFYHQKTFDTLDLPQDEADAVFGGVIEEVCSAFDWYMAHLNGGRPFILAGFSQGAELVKELLKYMDDGQYSRMAAAYLLGTCLTEEDFKCGHIKAAGGETDTGIAVSFNSVLSDGAVWPVVAEGAATCINPVNWHTDTVPGSFEFYGKETVVRVDTVRNVLVVDTDPEPYWKWMDEHPFLLEAGASRDCLHHWELKFYSGFIHENALKRIITLSDIQNR